MKYFSALIKPASSTCNMACKYCFYHDEVKHRTTANLGVMKQSTAHALIDKTMGYYKSEEVDITYAFQGGEPTCAGIDFFADFVSYVESRRKPIHHIHYSIQTNGTLLNQEWITFLKKYEFLVGVSIDGPKEIHDALRITTQQEPTYDIIMHHIQELKEADVPFNILSVLTDTLAQHAAEYWQWILDNHLDYVQPIACLPALNQPDQYSLTPQRFYQFYDVLFQLWKQEYEKGHYVSITLFDNVIPMFVGVAPSQCGYLGQCRMQYVIESDGSVYPCDFYAMDQYRVGNICQDSLSQLASNKITKAFLREPRRKSLACNDCPYSKMCGRQCKRMNVCYFDEKECAYRSFLEKYEAEMKRIARNLL